MNKSYTPSYVIHTTVPQKPIYSTTITSMNPMTSVTPITPVTPVIPVSTTNHTVPVTPPPTQSMTPMTPVTSTPTTVNVIKPVLTHPQTWSPAVLWLFFILMLIFLIGWIVTALLLGKYKQELFYVKNGIPYAVK